MVVSGEEVRIDGSRATKGRFGAAVFLGGAMLVGVLAACGGGGGGAGGAAAAGVGAASTTPATLEILTYNVAGLPDFLSQSHPAVNTIQISPLLNPYDLVLVQEDFTYHADLMARVTHPFQSTPAGLTSRPMNDGLNRFSAFALGAVDRERWATCFGLWSNANDCLADKGYSFSVLELAPGVEVDVYNLHADAGGAYEDSFSRQQQLRQLADRMAVQSTGRAVICAGDTNLHGFDPQDEPVLQSFLARTGLEDSCRVLGCGQEKIDRVFFRGSAEVWLQPVLWRIATEFVDGAGQPLSDHAAVHVRMAWRRVTP